jgi:transcriptional regulator with XRE-family HTH domain
MAKKKTPVKKERSLEATLLGKRIKQLRVAKGYSSQETFAYDNGYTLSYYSRVERGEDIRFTSLIKVCRALDTDLESLFSEGFKELKLKKK